MNHTEDYFKGVRGIKHYYQSWLPDEDIKALLLIVHGLGEHCGRYLNVVEHFVPSGYGVYGFDLLGHGKSEGKREYVERFEDYTDTLTIYLNMVKEWHDGKPIFLMGHSMGGLIAPYYHINQQNTFRGSIISAPLVKIGDNITQTTIFISKFLAKLLPRIGVQKLDPTGLCSNPDVVSSYINDPLVFHGKTPARLAAELLRALIQVNENMEKINLPVFIVQGGKDVLIDPEGAQILFNGVSSEDKTLKVYDDLYHEVFNETDCSTVFKDIEDWIENRL